MVENNNESRHEADIAISSRVRLARNISNIPFPGRMTSEQGRNVIKMVSDAIFGSSQAVAGNMVSMKIRDMNAIERQVLVEKHLISPDLGDSKRDSAVIISKDEKISIMINEEDHLSPTFGKFELKTARNHFLNPETRYLSGAILENRKVVTGNLQHFTIVYLQ